MKIVSGSLFLRIVGGRLLSGVKNKAEDN